MALGKISGGAYLSLGFNVKANFCKKVTDVLLTVSDGNIIISWNNTENPQQPVEVSYKYLISTDWVEVDTVTDSSIILATLPSSAIFRLRVVCDTNIYSFPVFVDYIRSVAGRWIVDDTASYCEEIFGNVLMSEQFRRDNCTPPAIGSLVTYTVPANTYFGSTQEEADDQAAQDILDNGLDYANDPEQSGSYCLAPSINSVIVCDMYDDALMDVCAYIDTPGVSQSNEIVARGINFYPLGVNASECLLLSSDEVTPSGSLRRRFQFNVGALIGLYPDDVAIPTFIYKVEGRTRGIGGTHTGQYSLKFPDQMMTMGGSPGSYIPTVTPGGGPAPTAWSSNIISGGDGSVGVGVGSVILTFTYNRSTNLVSLTTV